MQRLRTWMRQWLGIEALETANANLWSEYREMTTLTMTRETAETIARLLNTPPTPETPTATATPSEPDFFDPVMGRL